MISANNNHLTVWKQEKPQCLIDDFIAYIYVKIDLEFLEFQQDCRCWKRSAQLSAPPHLHLQY